MTTTSSTATTTAELSSSSSSSSMMMVVMERYVPATESASLAEDAPGYYRECGEQQQNQQGPVCWKCRGNGRIPNNNHKNKSQRKREVAADSDASSSLASSRLAAAAAAAVNGSCCPVCHGQGRLAARVVCGLTAAAAGKITRGRTGNHHAVPPGPAPAGYAVPVYGDMVKRATVHCEDVLVHLAMDSTSNSNTPPRSVTTDTSITVAPVPGWLPSDGTTGEELCNLTGHWRILQRRRSHRWTTDDLVTAVAAARELLRLPRDNNNNNTTTTNTIQYCDLGTGNASVLQMVLWKAAACSIAVQRAVGIEARSEAVGLARRSLEFNVGFSQAVSIVHADFRSYCQQHEQYHKQFDLITGTPPYFRVDFCVNAATQSVRRAVIRQGGMPTAVQSAPARCEFRGGLEAYCEAAVQLLKEETGIFCVCENYQNHERALAAFGAHKLTLQKLYMVEGKLGRGTLFCVYVLRKEKAGAKDPQQQRASSATVIELAVRDAQGEWTEDYATNVLEFMSIPVARSGQETTAAS